MERLLGNEADWQALISKLKGVYAAHVVFSEAGEPREIHVLAGDHRNSKAIVRDVQSAISARYGIDLDYHIISVAQITAKMQSDLRFRLAYAGIDMHRESTGMEVTVFLNEGERSFVGKATGSSAPFLRMRLIAKATLEAVGMALDGEPCFEFDSTELISSNGRKIVLSQIYATRELKPLIGCAYADPEPDAAVVLSVLDAINRKLEIYSQAF